MVLALILLVVTLSNVGIILIRSQSQLTQHQVSRIQAYYAAQAGLNYTREQLRTGAWGTGTYTFCRSGCTINDSDLPPYTVTVTIGATPGPGPGGTRQVSATVTYQ